MVSNSASFALEISAYILYGDLLERHFLGRSRTRRRRSCHGRSPACQPRSRTSSCGTSTARWTHGCRLRSCAAHHVCLGVPRSPLCHTPPSFALPALCAPPSLRRASRPALPRSVSLPTLLRSPCVARRAPPSFALPASCVTRRSPCIVRRASRTTFACVRPALLHTPCFVRPALPRAVSRPVLLPSPYVARRVHLRAPRPPSLSLRRASLSLALCRSPPSFALLASRVTPRSPCIVRRAWRTTFACVHLALLCSAPYVTPVPRPRRRRAHSSLCRAPPSVPLYPLN